MNTDTRDIVENDEIDLAQVIRNVWATRYTVLVCVAIFAALFGSYLFLKAAAPKAAVYRQVINFTFNGAQEGKYDNGERFSVEDIIAPAVVARVHGQLDLGRYGYDLESLGESLSISPYAPDRELIIKQYSPSEQTDSRFKNPAVIASEKEARDQLERELSLASSKAALIRMVDMQGGLPVEVARAVVAEIPKAWASIAISERGVTRPDIPLYTASYLKQAVGEEENIENLRVLWSYLKSFKRQVVGLLNRFPSAATVVEAQSGLTALDISLLLNDAEKTLVKIPQDWTARTEFRIGLNEPLFSSRLFDPALIEELDFLVILDILSQRIQLIRNSLKKLEGYPYSVLVTDPESGLALADLRRFLSDLDKYELRPIRAHLLQSGMSKQAESVPLYYEFRISELQRKVATLKAHSEVVQAAEARYVRGGTPVAVAGNERDGAVAQYSEGFLDRIMALNTKGDDLAYRQELNRRAIQIEEQAVSIQEDIQELQEYSKRFSQRHEPAAGAGAQAENLSEQLVMQRFQQFVPLALKRLQEYAEITQRISDRLFAAREIHALYSESEFAPESPAQYLRKTSEVNTSFAELLERVLLYTAAVHAVVDKIHTDKVARTADLYALAGNASVTRERLLTLRTIQVLVLGMMLTGFFAMLAHLLYRTVKRA